MELFYTIYMELGKALLYVVLMAIIAWAVVSYRRQGDPRWRYWIHGVIIVHFLIGGFYSGIRMLTTDPFQDMLTRRMFAAEAWFCFASVSFYFLLMLFVENRMERK